MGQLLFPLLSQGLATHGLWSESGPWSSLIWPLEPKGFAGTWIRAGDGQLEAASVQLSLLPTHSPPKLQHGCLPASRGPPGWATSSCTHAPAERLGRSVQGEVVAVHMLLPIARACLNSPLAGSSAFTGAGGVRGREKWWRCSSHLFGTNMSSDKAPTADTSLSSWPMLDQDLALPGPIKVFGYCIRHVSGLRWVSPPPPSHSILRVRWWCATKIRCISACPGTLSEIGSYLDA